jgi:hypothetical protein
LRAGVPEAQADAQAEALAEAVTTDLNLAFSTGILAKLFG